MGLVLKILMYTQFYVSNSQNQYNIRNQNIGLVGCINLVECSFNSICLGSISKKPTKYYTFQISLKKSFLLKKNNESY